MTGWQGTIRFGSVCSGIEAASVSFEPLGWKAAWFSEIEPFPCEVLAHHWPDTPNLGDMTTITARIRAGEVEAPEVLCGGTPCFTAGHMVLSSKGYVPIESIKVGDLVVTHTGRLRRVLRVGSKLADVGVLTGVGITEPIVCTPEHPFLSVQWRNQSTKRNNKYAKVEHCGDPEWIAAKDLPGRQWCQLTAFADEPVDVESTKFDAETAMYVAGMYLGDGWIRKHENQKKKSVCLGLNPQKLEKLKSAIGDAVVVVTEERTTVRATIHDTVLADWLLAHFGHYSHLKTIPSWVLGHKFRSAFLRGFLDTDGSVFEGGKISISTTSRSLAYGVNDLLAAEGHISSVAFVKTKDTCVIEGRCVNQRDYYQVRAYPLESSRKSRVRHGMVLRNVSGYQVKAGKEMVYNIEVDEDHSYLVQGAVVHNCQAFSIAGERASLDDARGNLTLTFCEIADAIDDIRRDRSEPACVVLWENVPGVLSTGDNAFGCFLAELAGHECALEPGPRPLEGRSSDHWSWKPDAGSHVPKWSDAGVVIGSKRAVAWRVLDAQFFQLAQRRRRVFVVASAREGFDPAAVLLEFDGLRRDSPPSREAGKNAAATPAPRTGAGGQPRSREGSDGYETEVMGTLDAGIGRRRGSGMNPNMLVGIQEPVFCMAHGQANAEIAEDRSNTLTCNHETQIVAYSEELGDVIPIHDQATRHSGKRGDQQDGKGNGLGVGAPGDPCHTLTSGDKHAVAYAFSCKDYGADATRELSPTMRAMGHDESHMNGGGQIAVAFAENSRQEVRFVDGDGQIAGALSTGGGKPGQGMPSVMVGMAVRRLTPFECAALQGFPRDHCSIPTSRARRLTEDELLYLRLHHPDMDDRELMRRAADAPQYKAYGNSWAVNCTHWIGKRLNAQLRQLRGES